MSPAASSLPFLSCSLLFTIPPLPLLVPYHCATAPPQPTSAFSAIVFFSASPVTHTHTHPHHHAHPITTPPKTPAHRHTRPPTHTHTHHPPHTHTLSLFLSLCFIWSNPPSTFPRQQHSSALFAHTYHTRAHTRTPAPRA